MKKLIILFMASIAMLYFTQSHAQTIKDFQAKSERFYYGHRFDSAVHYARLMEPFVIDSVGKNSSGFAYFTAQYYSMNYEAWEKNDSANYWYQSSITLFKNLHDTVSFEYGETLTNYGNFLNDIGSYADAYFYLKDAVSVMEKHKDNVDAYLASLNNLGNYYNYMGDYQQAENLYHQVLILIEETHFPLPVERKQTVLTNLASCNIKTGHYINSEEYFKKAIGSFKKMPDKSIYLKASVNLALFYSATERNNKAKEILQDLIENPEFVKHDGSSPTDVLAAYKTIAINALGNIEEVEKNYTNAASLYQQSIFINQRLTIQPLIRFSSMANLAHLYTTMKKYKLADSLYEQVVKGIMNEKNQDHFYSFRILSDYCENLFKMKNYEKTKKEVTKLAKLVMSDMYKNFAGMPEDRQLSYLVSLERHLSVLFSAFTMSGNENVKFALNNLLHIKGFILNNQKWRMESIRSSSDTSKMIVFKKWLSLKQMLYKASIKSSNQVKENSLKDSTELLTNYYDVQMSSFTGIKLEDHSASLADSITIHLRPNEAAIEFVKFENLLTTNAVYGAFVMRPGKSEPVFIKLCTEQQLIECFKMKNSKLSNTEYQLDHSAKVYELVWKPLEQLFKKGTSIYYSPAGLLNYIDFEAISIPKNKLTDTKDNTFLLQNYTMHQMSSTRNILNKKASAFQLDNAVLWGNINCSSNAYLDPSIKATASAGVASAKGLSSFLSSYTNKDTFSSLRTDELPVIIKGMRQKKLSPQVYESAKATEENFKQNSSSFCGLLHVSSHGFYATQPQEKYAGTANNFSKQTNPLMRCGLVLNGGNYTWKGNEPLPDREDGILTGYEIALMDFSKLNLVVLSACETGLGDLVANSEGALGLQRAFAIAGAKNMIMSLWSVNAKFSKTLMEKFYKNLLSGQQPSAALHNAKKSIAAKGVPYMWAGFVLVE